jgi:SagB-type dehydrogenase family enzyme
MKRNVFVIASMVWAISMFCAASLFAEDIKLVRLPNPQVDGGRPLMQVLKDRSSSRSFSPEKLSPQMLSNLLWAAFGVNRPETGKRTAPSAKDLQEIDIYVATAEGLYLYEAKGHVLKLIRPDDIRALTGRQDFVKEAFANLIYVADFSRMGNTPKEDKELYSAADTGFISQNVYLYCASERLATVVRGAVDKQALAKAMNLRPDQKIILAQTVGYPKK